MKKALALLLSVAMLFTVLVVSVSAETTENPSVTVVTHESTSEKTDFAIKLDGFTSLKGLDLVVTADDGVKMTGVSALNTKYKLEKDVNYTISTDGHTLHIVELSNDVNGDILTVSAEVVVAEAHTITVTGDLAKSGTALYDSITFPSGTINPYVAPTTETVEEEKVVAQPTDDTFIPYGAVYTGSATQPEYVAKSTENGSFTAAAGATVKTFKKPAGNFGTFGVSDYILSDNRDARQFGSVDFAYSTAKTYGTLVIIGDWAGFRDWYLSNKAYSDSTLMEKVYAAYNSANKDGTYSYVLLEAGNSAIKVYNVPQSKVMWQSGSTLEYAVRVSGLVAGNTYTAVAYKADTEGVNLSTEIKTVAYN